MSLVARIERGKAPLTVEECRKLRALLEADEGAVLAATGLTKTPVYRAAAEQSVYSATRLAIRAGLTALDSLGV